MANNRFVFEGLDELRAELRKLPETLTGEASHIIEGAANGAAATIKGHYARVSGNLVDGVSVTFQRNQFAAGALVKSASEHAWIYENGTQVRHFNGANRGSMPPAPPGRAFIPPMIKARRRMYDQFIDLLERHGLVVSGRV